MFFVRMALSNTTHPITLRLHIPETKSPWTLRTGLGLMAFESRSIHEPGKYAVQLATAQQNRTATIAQ